MSTTDLDRAAAPVLRLNEWPTNPVRTVVLGIQHPLTMFGGMVIAPTVIAAALGMSASQTALLISLCMVGAGITTMLQNLVGARLPLMQTVSLAFIAAYLSIGSQAGDPETAMRYIGGAVILGGILEAVFGYGRIVGLLSRVITPVVIGPVIILIALVVVGIIVPWAAGNFLIAGLTAALVLFLAVVLPRTSYGARFPFVRAAAVILTAFVVWLVSLIFSAAGVIGADSPAYIDLSLVGDAPWFVLPIPALNWGAPVFRLEFLLIILAGYAISMIESVGDYYAVAGAAHEPLPTGKQINRGIGVEGVGSALAGLVGGFASTTASENIGLVETTGVASRYIAALGGAFLIAFGFVGKIGALVTTITQPILAGLFVAILGMVIGVAFREFARAQLSSRNLLILGVAVILGLSTPEYAAENPVAISGADWLASTINGILTSMMAVGGIVAIVLDQLLPGSDVERGVVGARPPGEIETTAVSDAPAGDDA